MQNTPEPTDFDGIAARLQGVSRWFGPNQVLRDISFTVGRGQVLGFLGPNGAGKSTTMRILTGTLAPNRGQVTVCGQDMLSHPTAAKRHIGYLPETPPLYPEFTVDEYLHFCARLHQVPRRTCGNAVQLAKQRCGLATQGRRLIGNLSKGYRQRVGIAQAIVHQPDLVVLDEPTVGLDPIQIREIRTLIAELGEQHSVILSTHILSEVQAICTHVQIIAEGRLLISSPIGELRTHMGSGSLRLRLRKPPDTAALVAALPQMQVTTLDEPGCYRLAVAGGDVQRAIDDLLRTALDQGWQLAELAPTQESLEQVFVELLTNDSEEAQAA